MKKIEFLQPRKKKDFGLTKMASGKHHHLQSPSVIGRKQDKTEEGFKFQFQFERQKQQLKKQTKTVKKVTISTELVLTKFFQLKDNLPNVPRYFTNAQRLKYKVQNKMFCQLLCK